MKIVMLCDLYDEKLHYQENLLAKYYVKHGHEVTVVASTFKDAFDHVNNKYDRHAPPREYQDGAVKVIKRPYSLNVLNRLRRFAGVQEILSVEAPDLIFVHDIHLNLPEAARYKKIHPGCRLVMDYHGDYANSAKNWLSRSILHKVIRKKVLFSSKDSIDKIFPVVPASLDFLHEVYGVRSEEMTLLPLGADTDLAEETMRANAGAEVRRAHAIPDDAIVVFTGGKLTPVKRTHVLIEALRQIEDLQLHLLVVGDSGPEGSKYIEQLKRDSDGSERVHFAGWVTAEEVYKYMNACHLAVFPASRSVLWQQALSMGLPLVVGDVDVRDISYMNPYENVILLGQDERGSDGIARALRRLAENRTLLNTLSAAALRAADEVLNYHRIVSKTLDCEPLP